MDKTGKRLGVAIIVGLVTFLVVAGLGVVLQAVNVSAVAALGAFLKMWSWLVGILAGAFYYLTGSRLV